MKPLISIALMAALIFFIMGCAHVVPKEIRERSEEIPAITLIKNPDAYKGKFVILGGIIISSKNTEDGTYIEVLQKNLDYRGRPEITDISHGRFIIFYDGYIDTAIYSQGREITVAGEVFGKTIRPLGEIQYPYLLIKSRELYLFEPKYDIPIRFGISIWTTF